MRAPNLISTTILLFLINTGEGSALLMHGNSNSSDTIHGSGGQTIDAGEIKQMFLNLTDEVENLKRKAENDGSTIQVLRQNLTILGEEKKMLQNRVFFLEAELNKLNASKSPSSDELMAYLRSTKQIVQTLAANEEYDKNLTLRLNEAENNLAIYDKQNKNLTQRLNSVVNSLVTYDKQDKNFTQRLNEVMNNLAAREVNDKNLTQRLNALVNILTANKEYDKNITQQLSDAMNNLQDIKTQIRYTSLSLLDIHSKTDELNSTFNRNLDDRIRDVYRRINNITTEVAFTVGVTSSSSSWSSGTLVFDRIVYNIGGGYDPSTSVFTAPVDGHFVFFVNVQAYGSNAIYTYLVLNGSAKVQMMAVGSSGYYTAGPNLVVLRLQKGDRVWVKYRAGSGYYAEGDAPVTTFSGFLI